MIKSRPSRMWSIDQHAYLNWTGELTDSYENSTSILIKKRGLLTLFQWQLSYVCIVSIALYHLTGDSPHNCCSAVLTIVILVLRNYTSIINFFTAVGSPRSTEWSPSCRDHPWWTCRRRRNRILRSVRASHRRRSLGVVASVRNIPRFHFPASVRSVQDRTIFCCNWRFFQTW